MGENIFPNQSVMFLVVLLWSCPWLSACHAELLATVKQGIDGVWKATERCGQSDPFCPGHSALGLSAQTGQYRLLLGLRLASELIRNRTCHQGTEPWLVATHVQHPTASPNPLWGLQRGCKRPRSAARLTSDLLPCLDTSTHNTRPKADD